MTPRAPASPADYAAAFLAAAQELSGDRRASLMDGFIRVVEEDGARSAWPAIARELDSQSRRRFARVARAEDRAAVTVALGVGADVGVDPALLGGAIIRSGEIEIDGSLAGQLRQLAEHLRTHSSNPTQH